MQENHQHRINEPKKTKPMNVGFWIHHQQKTHSPTVYSDRKEKKLERKREENLHICMY
jgi:hypothetical protein